MLSNVAGGLRGGGVAVCTPGTLIIRAEAPMQAGGLVQLS